MKWWMVAVGVEVCDCGEAFLGTEADEFFVKGGDLVSVGNCQKSAFINLLAVF